MKHKIILIVILVIASILRLWGLSSYPSGLNADEAALGYNAYSLLLTGRDEHGHIWPVNLESFGDFKPAGYAYMLIPFVKVLGLNEFAVRLPSAIFGILAVVFIYLLVKELITDNCALIAAALLAVSPWHLHFSRGGWEVNVATTLLVMGSWFIVKWIKNPRFLYFVFCILCFVTSMYTYQSARLIAPLLGLGILVIYRKEFWKSYKTLMGICVLLAVLLLPLGWSILKTDAGSRLAGVGLLADLGPINRINELRGHYDLVNPPLYVRILYNKVTAYSLQFVYNYLSHFDGNFLFINGDAIQRSKVPETGLLYLTDFILVVLGAFYLLRSKNYEPRTIIIWWWLLVAPVAAAATFQVPHALRDQNMIIPLVIIMSVSVNELFKSKKVVVIVVMAILYLWQVSRYLHEYYVHYPKEYPVAWEYGFKDLVSYVNSVQDKYDKILVTDKYDQPYILFLFYQKYPPELFQGHHTLTFRDKFNFSTVRDYGKFHFGVSNPPHQSLVVATPEEVPENATVIKTINFPNGQPAFEIYEKN